MNRREMLKQTGLMGTGLVLGGVMGACATTPGMSQSPNQDVAVLNFALNLEYLEAAFYLAAVGRINEIKNIGGSAEIRLPSGFDGTSPIAGMSQEVLEYAQEIAEDELAHVKFLRQALGSAAVDRPVIDLDQAFRDAGNAASNGAITNFNPFANELFFIHGAFIFEDVGVTAYKGAAKLITDKNNVLDPAAGILAVEAYHAGLIRLLLHERKDMMVTSSLTVEQVVQAISDLRGSVGGGKDEGITKMGKANLVAADANAVAYGRTTSEVLKIVYLTGNAGVSMGGFFPMGLNGSIKTT
ncbi:MAG: ferritin-like domain-containing protein [Meiothermus ruber]|uniref:ferritin-like domain-containing protein n=1 Tax=Meiothermus taiwanensis TaxID=172827 RepID=UPI0004146B0A|nr:ferritin-like domain-containing protein [Meiothermus ruber]